MAASATDIEEFLGGPLVKWLATCIKKPDSLQVYETYFDGTAINEVLLQIDPEPSLPVPTTSNLQGLNITAARIKIFHCIIRNIKSIYEDELGQVVVSLPDCVTLGRAPASESSLEQLKLLILLLLGCAVQGPTKEIFIGRIKELDVDAQHDIVECIKQVTDGQDLVLTLDWTEQAPDKLYSHVRTLTSERDKLLQQWVTDLGQENINITNPKAGQEGVESNHWAVEMADWKARLRKQRQELEEKTEVLAEYKEELGHATNLVAKLKAENAELLIEARKVKLYRDEVDVLKERAERADRLDLEIQRYREKLADSEFYKVRVEELREDNRVLLETREMLEQQLVRARERADHALELEGELLHCKQTINDVILERDAAKEKIQELIDENLELQQVTKSALQEASLGNISIDSDLEESNSGDNSLSEQLTSNAQARALKLELKNKRLLNTIDSLRETSFQESANKVLDLEKEKKRLLLKCEQLQENCERLTQQKTELENLFKNAIQENRKIQNGMDSLKMVSDRQNQEIQNEKTKITDLEKNIESLSKEKQRVQSLCDVVKKRADDAEKCLSQVSEQLQTLQLSKQQEQIKYDKESILEDQKTLKQSHEQLNMEYDALKVDHEILKKINRDLRSEVRNLKEQNDCLEVKVSNSELEKDNLRIDTMNLNNLRAEHSRLKEQNDCLEAKVCNSELEKDNLRIDTMNLNNLRAEHSKLKDDFRNLFTASEKLKSEYRNVQEELKTLRNDSRSLRLNQTEIQGELNCRSDRVTELQLENARLQQKCDMLFEMNHSLDCDRRSLMDNVSQLLTQYHSLLTHSLEDKQQYHLEEKLYTDKVNNLCRQKEKLEEKIMEHYRRLDNASSKKKGFGATLVRRVRKAGSDIMNKVPRNRRSWHEDATRLTQSQFTLAGHGSGESDNRDSDRDSTEDTPMVNVEPRATNSLEPFRRNTNATGSLRGHKPRDEVALRRSHRDLTVHRSSIAGDQVFNREQGSALSLGSVGSRRTVYLSEDDAVPVPSETPPTIATNQNNSNPPLLVYNRISTVIGADSSQAQIQRPATPQNASPSQQPVASTEENANTSISNKKEKNAKETAIWYEYGCV